MNKVALLSAALILPSCNPSSSAPTNRSSDRDGSASRAETLVAAPPAAMSLLNTSWEIESDASPMVISIDRTGAYIEERLDGTHVDHGTYAQRNGKDCFTSAMGEKGTNCWTTVPQVEIGETASGTADDGNNGSFKRVAYRALKLPG